VLQGSLKYFAFCENLSAAFCCFLCQKSTEQCNTIPLSVYVMMIKCWAVNHFYSCCLWMHSPLSCGSQWNDTDISFKPFWGWPYRPCL